MPDTASLLTELAGLMIEFHEDSAEVQAFIESHRDDEEFFLLAPIAVALRKVLKIDRRRRS